MAGSEAHIVWAGARLLWRRQRLLWWVYAISLLLALMGTLPVALRVSSVLDRSLAAERLYKTFDLGVFIELISQPEISLGALVPGSLLFAVLFFLAMLFLTGGILEAYCHDRTLRAGEFFQACGTFVWPFARLLGFHLLALIPIALVYGLVQRWSGRLAADAPWEKLGFWVQVGGMMVVLFLLMVVRLGFDVAQVIAVVEGELRMRRALIRAIKVTFGNFGSLFWLYLRIVFVAAVGLAAAAWVWVKFVRPEWVGVSFLLGQAVVLLWLATRLWLRASETLWYHQHGLALSANYLDKLVA